MSDLRDREAQLVAAARQACDHAYAPYSGFKVGAAIRLTGGDIVTGANFENASYGLSLCAETVAIASANAAGNLANIEAIAVVGGPSDRGARANTQALTPCGRCRQILAEAATVAGRDIRVYCADMSGNQQASYTVSELLPHAFSPASLVAGPEAERE
ncbi:MAG: cytidine deaminase [Sphingobium sp.]